MKKGVEKARYSVRNVSWSRRRETAVTGEGKKCHMLEIRKSAAGKNRKLQKLGASGAAASKLLGLPITKRVTRLVRAQLISSGDRNVWTDAHFGLVTLRYPTRFGVVVNLDS